MKTDIQNSNKVILKSKEKGTILTFDYNNFPYLGIWAKPSGGYVCIEPWYGVGDHENTNQELTIKEGIIKLDASKTFEATYSIEIDNKHLV